MRYFADAVLDRTRRVEHLELGEDADRRVRAHPRDLDQWRVPDRVEDVRVPPTVRGEVLVCVAVVVVGGRRRPATGRPSSAAGHGRQQADFVGPRDRRIEPREVAHVLAVDVDVDESIEVAIDGQQLTAEAGWRSTSRSTTERIESPSISIVFAPPTFWRRTDGMWTVLIRAPRARPSRPDPWS